MAKIFCVLSTKGGVGKSTISFHILPVVLGKATVIEIDDNNDTSEVINLDEHVVSMKSVTLNEVDSAISSIVFQSATKDIPIIIDAGGGNDTKAVLNSLIEVQKAQDVTFIIPLTASKKQIKNAIDTYNLVKEQTNNIIFMKNSFDEKLFVFWDGSKEYGKEALKPKNCKDVFLPYTPLFDVAEEENMSLSKFAEMSQKHKFDDLIELANGNEEEFIALSASYRNSKKAYDYIQAHIKPLIKIIS